MNSKRSRSILLIAGTVLSAGILGCPSVAPGPEAVLEGTWELIPTDLPPQLAKCLVTFNSRGDVTRVKFTLVDETTITWNNPPSETEVDGDQVFVSGTTGNNKLTFDGTLDSETEPTIADGEFTIDVTFRDVTISEQAGEAILVKQ